MKLVEHTVEEDIIRAMGASKKISETVLSTLTLEHFHYSPTKEAFDRISKCAVNRQHIMTWNEICADPVIPQEARDILKLVKRKPVLKLSQIKAMMATLEEYRKLRIAYLIGKQIKEDLNKSSIDVDKMVASIEDKLLKAKSSTSENIFVHIGTGDNTDALIENIFSDSSTKIIPTGFAAFDNINAGIPRGALFNLCGSTGGGKTTIALQLSKNMALDGRKVCFVELEMDHEEIMRRKLSNISEVDMRKFLNPKKWMTKDEQKQTIEAYRKYKEHLQSIGAVETLMVPTKDVSIQDIMFLLKPYKYDVIIIDYIGLLKGTDTDSQWRDMGAVARYAKVFASNNNCVVIMCAQFDASENRIRYSRMVGEHSAYMWTWAYGNKEKETHILDIDQQKARQGRQFKFQLKEEFHIMRIRDLTPKESQEYALTSKQYDEKGRKIKDGNGSGGGNRAGQGNKPNVSSMRKESVTAVEPSEDDENSNENESGVRGNPELLYGEDPVSEKPVSTRRTLTYNPSVVSEDSDDEDENSREVEDIDAPAKPKSLLSSLKKTSSKPNGKSKVEGRAGGKPTTGNSNGKVTYNPKVVKPKKKRGEYDKVVKLD